MQDKPKYRLKEAAARIGIGKSTLRRKIKAREIGAEKIGWRTVFVYQSEIDAYLERKSTRFNLI